MKRLLLMLVVVVAVAGMAADFNSGTATAASGEVLILSSSVTGGAASPEALAVTAAGKTPVVATPATWSTMTASDFDDYDAIVLGDPTCSTDTGASVGAAVANAATWGSVIDGNVILIATDPTFHQGATPGAGVLIDQGIGFAVDEAGATGLYLTLSCYYHFDGAGTPVPLLDGIEGGGFTVIGAANLPGLNDVHITAAHPALAGLTDADLSNWGNSVHAGFETWPATLSVLAVARDAAGPFTAPDGTVGYPYILAMGEQLEVCGDGIDNDGDGLVDEGCDGGGPTNTPPSCDDAAPSVSSIWPPNHKMVPISIDGVTDADGDAVTITITGITQDEAVDGNGSGNTGPDGTGVGTDTAEVRAEREGVKGKNGSNGRVYEISFTADDGNGGSCTGTVQVGVPHDQKPGNDPVDDGQDYDSTGA